MRSTPGNAIENYYLMVAANVMVRAMLMVTAGRAQGREMAARVGNLEMAMI